MTSLVAVDIGGTHARFALAEVAGGRVMSLGEATVLRSADHAGLAQAWKAFAAGHGGTLPDAAALGVAGPVTGGPVHFVNSHWVVDPSTLKRDLGVERSILINDFGAMAHAAHALGPADMVHLCGPEGTLPEVGAISVIGPGTGLGVAVLQRAEKSYVILGTEGAHIHFAPLNEEERRVCDSVITAHGRASVERIVSVPGLGEITRSLNASDARGDAALWDEATESGSRSLDVFLACYGSAVGDLALAHGAMAVVLAGGLTNRIAHILRSSRFHDRFCDKGRYRARMESIPIKLITHPQPGLFGAAAAFAKEYAG